MEAQSTSSLQSDLRAALAEVVREELQRALSRFESVAEAALEMHKEAIEELLATRPVPELLAQKNASCRNSGPEESMPLADLVVNQDSSTHTAFKNPARERQATQWSKSGDRLFGVFKKNTHVPSMKARTARKPSQKDPADIRAQHSFTNGMQSSALVTETSWQEKLSIDVACRNPTNVLLTIMTSSAFTYLMSLIIIMNAILIGVQIEMELRGEPVRWLTSVEHAFLGIYLIEFGLNCVVYGRRVLHNNWLRFDFIIVTIGVSASWVAMPLVQRTGANNRSTTVVEQILIFRLLRLFRYVKALRLISHFETLSKLVSGLINSMKTMISAIAVILLTIFIIACIGAELITKSELRDHPVAGPVIESRFDSLPRIIMTLFQFTNDDSVSQIYRPLVESQPWLGVYFLIIIIVVSFCLMNLVTAIIVEDSIKRAHEDEELQLVRNRRRFRKYKPVIEEVFNELDTLGIGTLRIQDILRGCGNLQTQIPRALQGVLDPERLADIFEYIDLDRSGSLSIAEFLEGIAYLMSSNVPVENLQSLSILREQRKRLAKVEKSVAGLHELLLAKCSSFLESKSLEARAPDATGAMATADPAGLNMSGGACRNLDMESTSHSASDTDYISTQLV